MKVKAFGDNVGTFQLKITNSAAVGGGGDPCIGGATLTENGEIISFQPDGNYEDNADCRWTVSCDNGGPVALSLEQFETEADYDWVNIFDGEDRTAPALGKQLSGNLVDLSTTQFYSTGATLTLELQSDDSVGAGGFEASYTCVGLPTPTSSTEVIDCVGSFSECSETCTKTYSIQTPARAGGRPCDLEDAVTENSCAPGEGMCPSLQPSTATPAPTPVLPSLPAQIWNNPDLDIFVACSGTFLEDQKCHQHFFDATSASSSTAFGTQWKTNEELVTKFEGIAGFTYTFHIQPV